MGYNDCLARLEFRWKLDMSANVAIPAEVIDLDSFFGRSFQLTQTTDPLGDPLYTLNMQT